MGSRERRRVATIIGVTGAAVLLAIGSGVITLPNAKDSSPSAQADAQASLAAARTAADQQWADATCTTILDWKNEVRHDGTSLDLSFGALSRIQDAITSTTRMLNAIERLGGPPATRTPQARADLDQLRSDLELHVHTIQGAASSVLGGNVAAIGTLVSDLENEHVLGTQIVNALRPVFSVDLGLSLAETRACRQLVGIPI